VTDTVNRIYEWDITAYIQAEKNAGRNLVSLAMKATASSSEYTVFNSREASSNKPELVVSVDGALSTLRFTERHPASSANARALFANEAESFLVAAAQHSVVGNSAARDGQPFAVLRVVEVEDLIASNLCVVAVSSLTPNCGEIVGELSRSFLSFPASDSIALRSPSLVACV
jgi:hypothetical protein